jgi:hypothetical protein
VELQSRCRPTRFEGEWGVLPSGDMRYFGAYSTTAERSPVLPAQMQVQAVAGSADRLQLLLQEANGQTLLGPLQLQRVAAAPGDVPVCP